MRIKIEIDKVRILPFDSKDYKASETPTPIRAMLEDIIAFFTLMRNARKEE